MSLIEAILRRLRRGMKKTAAGDPGGGLSAGRAVGRQARGGSA